MNARAGLLWIVRAAALYAALIAASVAGGLIFYRGVEAPEGFDVEAFQRASFIITAVNALMLAVLATRMRLPRVGRAGLLFALFFGIQTALNQMEAVYFAENYNFPLSNVPRDLGAGALTAFIGAIVAALMFGRHERETGFAARPRASLAWRFALATALYPVAYWTAGIFFVYQNEVMRAHISGMDEIEPGPLLAFQILRGAIWASLAFAAVHGLRGAVLGRAILVGAAFAVFMAIVLLYPNPFMSAPARMVHSIEIVTSNFLYGLVAALLLAPSRNRETAAVAA